MTNGTSYKVASETVQSSLLYNCKTIEEWNSLGEFNEEDFSSIKDIYRFFREYANQYGSLPTHGQISNKFSWNPTAGDFKYWYEEQRRYSLARKIAVAVRDGYSQIEDPDKSLTQLLDKLGNIRTSNNKQVSASDFSSLERLDKFDARTEWMYNGRQMLGCRTSFKVLNDTLMGWMPGHLVGCYARTNVGKTWWLIKEGVINWMDGYTVLGIFPEMVTNELEIRFDLVAASEMGQTLHFSKLWEGDPSIRAQYEAVLCAMSQSKRWWTYASLDTESIGVREIASLINLHKPPPGSGKGLLVLVDGIGQLKSSSSGAEWEKMKQTSYELKGLATRMEVPILITHQASNTQRGRKLGSTLVGRGDDFTMPSLNESAYGDAFVTACSDIITMCPDSRSKYITWYSIRKSRQRGWDTPLPDRMGMAVDFRTGRMYDLGNHGHEPDTVLQEASKLLGILI